MDHLLIVDDHPLYCTGLRITLARALQDAQVFEAASADHAMAHVRQHPATDLVLIDVRMAGTDGFSLLRQLGDHSPHVARMMMSGDEHPDHPQRARQLGASGFLSKAEPLERCLQAVRTVLSGGLWFPEAADTTPAMPATSAQVAPSATDGTCTLTMRQMEVLWLMAEGHSNKDIARALAIAERTVKAHLAAAFLFLGARSRTQALLEAQRRGLLLRNGP